MESVLLAPVLDSQQAAAMGSDALTAALVALTEHIAAQLPATRPMNATFWSILRAAAVGDFCYQLTDIVSSIDCTYFPEQLQESLAAARHWGHDCSTTPND